MKIYIRFLALFFILFLAQTRVMSQHDHDEGLRKVASGSSELHLEINIDEDRLESDIEAAVENAIRSTEILLEGFRGVDLDFSDLDLEFGPVDIDLHNLDIDIEPVELDMDDWNMDNTDANGDFDFDDDRNQGEIEAERGDDGRSDDAQDNRKSGGLKRLD